MIEEFIRHIVGYPLPPGEGHNYAMGHYERFRQSMQQAGSAYSMAATPSKRMSASVSY